MAGSLPLVRGGTAQALYPVHRTISFLTDIGIGLNATEQRFKRRPALTNFTLPYTRISGVETATMRAFYASQKGTYDSTWSLTLGAITYGALTFIDDAFTAREEAAFPGSYSFTLRCRQTANPGMASGAAGAAFPVLSSGIRAQLPYSNIRRASVLVNDNPIGPRYSWTWFGGGLIGFPAGALHGWTLEFPVLTDADLATIETHFRSQWGRYALFTFQDPDDGASYPNCRYDLDTLDVTHAEYNSSSLTVRILETN